MSLSNILCEKIEINIENVVATSSLNQKVNIQKILRQFPNSKYDPDKFPGAVIRLDNPRSVILVFKSGSIVSTGTHSEKEAQTAINRFVLNILQTQKLQNSVIQDMKIENIVASCNIQNKIHLEQAARVLPRSMYEPEQFPAIIHRLHYPKTVALIFASGRIVCVGAKSSDEIQSSVNTVHMELQQQNLILCDSTF